MFKAVDIGFLRRRMAIAIRRRGDRSRKNNLVFLIFSNL
jgi:hypothetical protein